MSRPRRVAVVHSHPIQYSAPLYAYLNRDPMLEVTALYCSDFGLRGGIDPGFGRAVTWDVDLLSGYPHVFMSRRAGGKAPTGFWSIVCPRLWSEIRSGRYDAVWVHGYNHAAHLIAFAAAKTKRLPVLMRSETHLGLHRSALRQRLRDSSLAVAYRFVDAFLAIGRANRDYYRALGVSETQIFDVPYAVDNGRFIASAERAAGRRTAIREKYGLPIDEPVVLYAAKLIRRKHPHTAIRALAALQHRGCAATMFVVGSGEMEEELRQLAATLGLMAVFAGFVNQSELPDVYAASDIFVLAAENEPWGLVVNEVMCAALPVVVSNQVGCVADIVKAGVNGYVVPPDDVTSLANALELLLRDEQTRLRMGAASRRIINRWNFEECRRGLTAALSSVAHS
jgi:glycosyltransferase involved in cell wall biosynthesis